MHTQIPEATCDLTMKGGIASGVVYPKAVEGLSAKYRVVNVGGASAGAIAAALTAAAEYGRQHGVASAYADVGNVGDEMAGSAGGATGLLALFEPEPSTRPLFDVLTSAMDCAAARTARTIGRLVRVGLLEALSRNGWWRAGGCAVPGTFVAVASFTSDPGVVQVVAGVLGVLAAVAGVAAGTVWSLTDRLRRAVPANAYGLVTGLGADGASGAGTALTPWLTRRIDEIAGLTGTEGPLTFAHLWGVHDTPTGGETREEARRRLTADRGARRVNLEVMSTDLAQGRPRRLPVLQSEELYFSVAEFRTLFPARVVDAMVECDETRLPADPATPAEELAVELAGRGFRRLPVADMPVVVAARMSLSFPVLISAVPLYELDTTGTGPRLRRNWISDGGITSNMPLHFFDAPLPKRPSFAINLKRRLDGEDAVTLPTDDRDGVVRTRDDFGDEPGSVPAFVSAIARTMQNWVDNEQMRMPGYRDRIVAIGLTKDQGGLNLRMPPELIGTLTGFGAQAATSITERFHDGGAVGWQKQRWIRYRSVMAMTERLLNRVDVVWKATSVPVVPTYQDMATAGPGVVTSYPVPPAAQEWTTGRAVSLAEEAAGWNPPAPGVSFTADEPTPVPHWRAQPEL